MLMLVVNTVADLKMAYRRWEISFYKKGDILILI